MNKYIVKKLITIFLAASVFVAIFVTIKILNKTDYIQVDEPNTKDIIPKKNVAKTTLLINVSTENSSDLYK